MDIDWVYYIGAYFLGLSTGLSLLNYYRQRDFERWRREREGGDE